MNAIRYKDIASFKIATRRLDLKRKLHGLSN